MCLSHSTDTARPSNSHLPCRAHTIPDHSLLLKATAQQGRRQRACGLLDRIRLLPATTRSSLKFLSGAYQSQMQVASVKPNTVCHWRGKEWQQHTTKKTMLHCGLAVRIFSATMRTVTKDTALSEQGRGAACYVWIGLKTSTCPSMPQ